MIELVHPSPESFEEPQKGPKGISIDRVQRKTRKSAKKVLAEHAAEVEEIYSKRGQIADYGEEKWKKNFKKLSDIEEMQGTELKGQGLRDFIWDQFPDCHLKRYQLLFSDPKDYIVPDVWFEHGFIRFADEQRVNRTDLRPLIFDPRRITETFLEKNFIAEFSKEDDAFERLKKINDSIPQVKVILGSSELMDPRNPRLIALGLIDESILSCDPRLKQIHRRALGNILYLSNEPRKSLDEPLKIGDRSPKRVSVYTSADSALRKTQHQERQYEDVEKPEITYLELAALTLNNRFEELWTRDAADETKKQLTGEALELIDRFEKALHRCSNLFKERALEMMASIEEKLRKKRVAPAMAKMVATRNAIEQRSEDIDEIQDANYSDRSVLRRAILSAQQGFKAYRKDFPKYVKVIEQPRLALYNKEFKGDREQQAANLMKNIPLPVMENRIQARPAITYIECIKISRVEMQKELRDGNQQGARIASIQIHALSKMEAADSCKHKLIEICGDENQASVARIQLLTSRICDMFEARELYPEIEPEHVAADYEPLNAKLASIKQRAFSVSPMIELNPKEFKTYLKNFIEELKAFDIEEIAWNLALKTGSHQAA